MSQLDEIYQQWQKKADSLLDEALAFLVGLADNPFSEEQLLQWTTQLTGFRFQSNHVKSICELMVKEDPHLAEAGLRLAIAISKQKAELGQSFEAPLAQILSKPNLDPWLMHAAISLLEGFVGPAGPQFVDSYNALAAWFASTKTCAPQESVFQRTMFIDPHAELIELFEKHLVQTLTPTQRVQILLPILEQHHNTTGWRQTLEKILATNR